MLTLIDKPELTLALGAIISFALGGLLWLRSRLLRTARAHSALAVVSQEDANAHVYPYVFVNDAGVVRELLPSEKRFLETPFPRGDVSRPYVKLAYDERNLGGTLSGYCRRAAIPRGVRIGYAPIEFPPRPRVSESSVPSPPQTLELNGMAHATEKRPQMR